jgi:hypothetical protein
MYVNRVLILFLQMILTYSIQHILLELACRMSYCLCVYLLVNGFGYLNQALILEYFSGLFTNYYQNIEFNFLHGPHVSNTVGLDISVAMHEHFYFVNCVNINESKSWGMLSLSNLSYFYCLQFQTMYLHFMVQYNCFVYVFLFSLMQIYALCVPGLLNYQKFYVWLGSCVLIFLLILLQFDSHCLMITFLVIAQELALEPVDSELQTFSTVGTFFF